MPREIQDENAIWTLAQVYAGLENLHSTRKDVGYKDGLVWVTATPNGGAQSVRMHLSENWEDELSDEDLLKRIVENSD